MSCKYLLSLRFFQKLVMQISPTGKERPRKKYRSTSQAENLLTAGDTDTTR